MFLEGILFSIIIPFFMIWAVIEKCVNVTIVGKSEKKVKRKCVIFWCGQAEVGKMFSWLFSEKHYLLGC